MSETVDPLVERLNEALSSRYGRVESAATIDVRVRHLLTSAAVALDIRGELAVLDTDAVTRFAPLLAKPPPSGSAEGLRRRSAATSAALGQYRLPASGPAREAALDAARRGRDPEVATFLDAVRSAPTPEEARRLLKGAL